MNSMLHLKDPDFGQAEAENSELLLKVSPSRLSYAVINSEKKISALCDTSLQMPVAETLDELLTERAYLKFSFKNIKTAVQTFNFTFIPQEIYSENDLHIYQSLYSRTLQDGTHVSNILKAGIKTVFNYQENLIKPLKEHYPQTRIYSQADPLIEGVLNNYQGHNKLMLQFGDQSFEIAFLSNGQLQFYNIFEISTPDDFNYYLLLTLQQLELSESNIEVLLSGDIDAESLLFKRVEKYFTKISFSDNVRINKFEDQFKDVRPHQFFSLLSLHLCE